MKQPIMPKFLSVGDVADILGVTPPTVRRMIERKELRAITWGNKRQTVRVPLDAINELLGSDQTQAQSEQRSTIKQ